MTLLHQLYNRGYLSRYVLIQILCISGLNGRSTCKVILIISSLLPSPISIRFFLISSVEFEGSHHWSLLPIYFHILSPLPNLFLSVEYEWDPDINIMIHLPLYYPYLYCWIWRGASEVPLSILSFPSFTLSFCYLFILKGDSGILSLCYLSNLKGDSGGPLHLVNQGVFTQVNLP